MENGEHIVVDEEISNILSPQEMTIKIKELQNDIIELEKKLDFVMSQAQAKTPAKKQRKKYAWVWDICFYITVIVLILAVFMLRSSFNGKPFTFAGYSAFTVLTSSMEEAIPKGSLVVTKSVDAKTLQIGDDITYMSGPTSTITHRIIGIEEKYGETNARAFETKGIMNKDPDKQLVPAANVVGKVVYHNKTLGDIATYLRSNWPYVIFVMVIIVALLWVLKRINEVEDEPNKPKKQKKKKKRKKKKKKEPKLETN